MRHSEFRVTDPETIQEVLGRCEYGTLSLLSGGEPYGVAVNFAYRDGLFYFHGSREGRKAEAIGGGAACSFLAVEPYAFIPSHFSGTRSACPASQFFASIHVRGKAFPLEDPAEKAFGLTVLMEKMQPEGGYDPIDPAHPAYAKMVEKTGVYKIVPADLTLKVKAGQQLTPERKASLLEKLRERSGGKDLETERAMEHFAGERP